jgi:nucleoside-diphosphate-sugar epimerase
MRIVVIGGSGLIGTNLVSRLRQKGHEVVAASPASGVNTITREHRAFAACLAAPAPARAGHADAARH